MLLGISLISQELWVHSVNEVGRKGGRKCESKEQQRGEGDEEESLTWNGDGLRSIHSQL